MEDKFLQDAGLTKGEARAYLALLQLGQSSVGAIAKNASISLSKIYEVLDNLIKKGLVSSILKNNVRHFSAADPDRIIDYLQKRKDKISESEEQIKKLLPALKRRQDMHKRERTATLYEDFRGIKTFYEQILNTAKKGESIFVMSISRYPAQRYEGYFLNWNKRRSKKGVALQILFNFDTKDLGKKRERIKHTQVRYLFKQVVTPAWILIFRSIVATIHLTEKPICVVIDDQNVAKSYYQFFQLLWKQAR